MAPTFEIPFTYSTLDTGATTLYDGVNKDKYVSYLKLDGTFGATVTISNTSLNANVPYTIMLWIKPFGQNWNTKEAEVFSIINSLQCYFTISQQLFCESLTNNLNLDVSTASAPQNEWIHLTISGSI